MRQVSRPFVPSPMNPAETQNSNCNIWERNSDLMPITPKGTDKPSFNCSFANDAFLALPPVKSSIMQLANISCPALAPLLFLTQQCLQATNPEATRCTLHTHNKTCVHAPKAFISRNKWTERREQNKLTKSQQANANVWTMSQCTQTPRR